MVAMMGISIGGRTPEEFLFVCTTPIQRYSIFFTDFYLWPLIMLFFSFYVKTYADNRRGTHSKSHSNEKVSTPTSTHSPITTHQAPKDKSHLD